MEVESGSRSVLTRWALIVDGITEELQGGGLGELCGIRGQIAGDDDSKN